MTEHERRELEPPPTPLKRGDKGPKVKQVQEWLTLHGLGTAIDGDFGPATEAALKAFQAYNVSGHESGVVGGDTWVELTWFLRRAVSWQKPAAPNGTGGIAVVACAREHLAARPREVGGPNSGPWVRLYMDGQEGPYAPWCAGFATYVLRQALGHDKWRTFSCDELAGIASHERRLVLGPHPNARKLVKPGCLFLIRHSDRFNDWTHCGIVTAVGPDYFETIEGNTNQGGSREGTEVCKRARAFNARTDFILMGDNK